MKNKPLVSIFVPVYNAERFIVEAVDSFAMQTYENIEVVISDDASTDSTPEILTKLKDKYGSKLKLFLQEHNLGITKNANFILSKCEGDFIIFSAGDDKLAPDCASKMIDYFQKDDSLLLIFNKNIIIDEYSNTIDNRVKEKSYKADFSFILKKGLHHNTNGMCLKKKYLPSDGFDENLKLASDILFVYQVIENNGFYLFIDENLSFYRKHSGSITSNNLYQCQIDNALSHFELMKKYPRYSRNFLVDISENFRNIRKFDNQNKNNYIEMIKTSLGLNPFNLKSLLGYVVYYVTFSKIKL